MHTKLYSLSLQQEAIWSDQQLHLESPIYNIGGYLKLPSKTDLVILEHCLKTLLQKLEALHVFVTRENGKVYQKFTAPESFRLDTIDLSQQKDDKAEFKKLINEELNMPFNVFFPPLFKFFLIKRKGNLSYLFAKFHHLIIDGQSVVIFVKQLFELYQAANQGKMIESYQYPSYTSYLSWQQNCAVRQNKDFWQEIFKVNPTPLLELGTLPNAVNSSKRKKWLFSKTTALNIIDFAKQNNINISDILMAIIFITLGKIFNKQRIAVRMPVANRTRWQHKELVGLLMQTVPFVVDTNPYGSFLSFIKNLRKNIHNAYKYRLNATQQISEFYSMVKFNTVPIDTVFSYNTFMPNNPHYSKASRLINWLAPNYQKYPLFITATLDEQAKKIELLIDIRVDAIKNNPIDLFFDSVEAFAALLLKNPITNIINLNYLAPKTIAKLSEFNRNERSNPSSNLIELFDIQVDKNPSKQVFFDNEGSIDFATLHSYTNIVADALHKLGVTTGSTVGILMDKSINTMICLIAIIKVGGIFLPLDTQFPEERLNYILNDSQSQFVITDAINQKIKFNGKVLLWSNIFFPQNTKNMRANYNCQLGEIAYIIYTSGSTGLPKGVKVKHSSLVNILLSMLDILKISALDKILSITTIAFDIAYLELFLPIISGVPCYLISHKDKADAALIGSMLKKHNITLMQATPTTWRLLLNNGWEGRKNLKVITGGEALTVDLAVKLLEKCKDVWNMYGPTETTIWSTSYNLNKKPTPIYIGKPIDNTQVYILDRNHAVLPIGVSGEICISGMGLACGYINNDELTQAKFIDIIIDNKKQTVYKTGDIGKWHANGNIEYLYREDTQVKFHGYRIELKEIESRLLNLLPIKEATVKVTADNHLCAYFTSEEELSSEFIKNELTKFLPQYMIPSHYIQLTALPQTLNGKIDMNALPEPNIDNFHFGRKPKNEMEKILASLWSEVLKIDVAQIRSKDSFIDLGGTSVEIANLMAKIQDRFNLFLPLEIFLMNHTLSSMAAKVELELNETQQQ